MSKQALHNDLREKLHNETAQIAWTELQRFFAQGSLFLVKDGVDLIEVAIHFTVDQTTEIKPLIEDGTIALPSNAKAREWFENNSQLWGVVVAPFVLVQEKC